MQRLKNKTKMTLVRRHAAECPLYGQPHNFGCECPLYAHGKIEGVYQRPAMDTRSYAEAETKLRNLINGIDWRVKTKPTDPDGPGGGLAVVPAPVKGTETFEQAHAAFLKTGRTRLAENTFAKYDRSLRQFGAYLAANGITLLRDIDTEHVRAYFDGMTNSRNGETPTPKKRNTKQGELDDLRTFFNWVKNSKRWIEFSPAADRNLNQNGTKTGGSSSTRKPFTPAEITRIIAAVEMMPAADRDTARGLVYLMLYTGMRICDTTFCERAWIKDVVVDGTPIKTIDFFQIKTRCAIKLPPKMQQVVLDALAKMPASRVYFFVADRADDYAMPRAALRDGREFKRGWKKAYDGELRRTTKIVMRVLALAGVDGTCHSFRDTFAINLLSANQNIVHVSHALGHSDIKITMNHYMKLVPGYREQMSTITDALAYVFPKAA